MQAKTFRISCFVIIFLQLLSVYFVGNESITISDSMHLILMPALLVLMLDLTPWLTVDALVKLIRNKKTGRTKMTITMIMSIISELIIAFVWICFMIVLLKNTGDEGYVTGVLLLDVIIMFYPVAAVALLTPMYTLFRLGIKFPERKHRRKKSQKDDLQNKSVKSDHIDINI